MYAKSFIAFDGNGRLTGARTAQTAPYDRYTCHLCGSALRYHPQYDTERPWFEHTDDGLTEHGQQCPYGDLLQSGMYEVCLQLPARLVSGLRRCEYLIRNARPAQGVQRYRNLHFIWCFAPTPFVTQRRDTGYPQSCLPE